MNSTIKPKPCKTCQSSFHSAMWHKPRKPIPHSKLPTPSHVPLKHWKRPKQIGKVAEAWSETRRLWLAQNPGKHLCHYCGVAVPADSITLDHKIPRSRAPHLRYELTNLVPACFACNGLKGSVDHDSYQHTCYT